MLADFFFSLRSAGLKPSITEYLTLLEAMQADQANSSVDDFYYLSRACLVKDEALFDRFDRVFGVFFKHIDDSLDWTELEIPLEWLQSQGARLLSEEDRQKIEALGGWEKLLEEFRKRAAEQDGRHSGGNKWIGTGGTSPSATTVTTRKAFASAANRAIAVQSKSGTSASSGTWTSEREIGTRNLKLALRRLRRFAREGAADQLDLNGTIDAHGPQRRVPGPEDGAGAAQCSEGAAVPGCRRVDEPPRAALRDSCSQPPARSSSTSSTTTFTTACTKSCGATIAAAGPSEFRPPRCCTSTARTTS